MEFNKKSFIWELRESVEVEQKKVDEIIFLLSDFIKSVKSFTGTATELVEKLKEFNGTEYSPPILKKKIIKHMDFLIENSISYSENRTFERREFTLVYDGKSENDGMTVENFPINLPSLPSALSAESNLATVAPCSSLCEPLTERVG